MKEDKNKSNDKKEKIVTDKYSKETAYTGNELNDELERLAETFRQELKKAQNMSDEEFEEAYVDDEGIIPQNELCACCGERRRDKSFGENYEYCAECRENMKKYPISWQGVATAVVMIGIAIFSIITFAGDFKAYDYGYKAEKYLKETKLTSAINSYDSCVTLFKENEVNAQKMYFDCAKLVFNTMDSGMNSMQFVNLLIEDCVTPEQSRNLLYGSIMDVYYENKLLLGTMNEFYSITEKEEYAEYDAEDEEMYEKIMADIEGIASKEIAVVSLDGKTTEMMPASEAIVRFCQYIFAYSSNKYDESIAYMRMVRELKPEYYWLYGYELGMAELQNGNAEDARGLAKEMMAQNRENPNAYLLHSAVDRMTGKYENAVSWTEDGLKAAPESHELYRYKAMAHVALGQYNDAEDAISKALDLKQYTLGYMTAIVIENELGNTEAVEEMKSTLEEDEVELTEKMNNYLKGKITAKQMFTEGTGDVE